MAKKQTTKNLPAAVEQRAVAYNEWTAGSPVIIKYLGLGDAAGVHVDEDTAMEVPAVKYCVARITRDLATMNLCVWQRIKGGAVKLPDHPISTMLDYRPNGETPSAIFWAYMVENVLKTGNAYAEIVWKDKRIGGIPLALNPIRPDRVTVDRDDQGNLIYKVAGGRGVPTEILPAASVIHLRTEQTDPRCKWAVKGLSPIEAGQVAIGVAMAQQTAVANFFKGGMHQPGYYTVDGGTDETVEKVKENLGRNVLGVKNSDNAAVYRDNVRWVSTGVDPDKAQMNESRKAQDAQICLVYNFPPSQLYQDATYAGNEVARRSYRDDTLRGYGVLFEQELTFKLLRNQSDLFIEYDYDQYLRTDPKTQREIMNSDIMYGRADIDEQRAELGKGPTKGGNQTYITAQLLPLLPPAKPEAVEPTKEAPIAADNGLAEAVPATVEPAAAALNGAQIQSFIGVLTSAANGQIPLAAVEPILAASFPTLPEATIAALVKSLDGFTPAPPPGTTPPEAAPPADVENQDDNQGDDEQRSVTQTEDDDVKQTAAEPEQRSALVQSQRKLMADVLDNLLTKETRARKKADLGEDWYQKHAELIEKRVGPIVDSCRSLGLTVDSAEEIARNWIDTSKQALAAYTDGGHDDQALDALLFTWKSTRVDDACTKHVR